MQERAKVISVEALVRFKTNFSEFGEAARLALVNAENDIRKTMWWLQNEQRQHWQRQIKKMEKKLTEAKTEYRSAEMASRDTRPSLVLERKRVQKAQSMLDEARHKLERVRYWSRILERELLLYKGQTQSLASKIERDVPKGLARLTNMMDSLDKYMKLNPGGDAPTSVFTETEADDDGEATGQDPVGTDPPEVTP